MDRVPVTRSEAHTTLKAVVEGFQRHHLLVYASAISYQLLAALIPFACFALGLASFFHLESLWRDHLAPEIQRRVSSALYAVIDDTVTQVLAQRQIFWVTIGLVLTLWQVSGAVRTIMTALDAIYQSHRRRGWLEWIVRSLWLGAACGALVLPGMAAPLLLPPALGWPLAALALALSVGMLVRFAPAARQPLPWVSFGSLLVVLGWIASSALYNLYVSHIADYNSIFGSLAAGFVLIFFVYLSATVFLVGLLVDASVRREMQRMGKRR